MKERVFKIKSDTALTAEMLKYVLEECYLHDFEVTEINTDIPEINNHEKE